MILVQNLCNCNRVKHLLSIGKDGATCELVIALIAKSVVKRSTLGTAGAIATSWRDSASLHSP